jgi:signal transduction histidine kinase
MVDQTARLVAAVDAERRQLERRLHDGVQQQLIAVAVRLQLLDQLTDTDAVEAKKLIADIRNEVREALAELRLLAGRIYAPHPGGSGLAASLRAAAAAAGVATRIDVSAKQCGDDVAATVYACCLLALEAIAEGSAGAAATIAVRDEQGAVVFEVAAPVNDDPFEKILGLAEARVVALGGQLSVTDARLTGTIPYP